MWNKPSKEQLAKIPPLDSQSEVKQENVIIHLHFFSGACDWWISEYDGDDVFFGFVNLGDPDMAEWGTISFRELENLKTDIPFYSMKPFKEIGRFPIEVDCDKYWQPKKVSEIWPGS